MTDPHPSRRPPRRLLVFGAPVVTPAPATPVARTVEQLAATTTA